MTAHTKSAYTLLWQKSIGQVDQQAWDAIAVPLKTPILEWEWLHLMEVSGSITIRTGWQPCHLTLWAGRRLVAAAPLYVKAHSAGEFVFDHVWADLAGRLGIDYYPKLVGMSPVTPAVGYRFLVAPGEDEDRLTALMVDEIDRFCRRNGISGASFLFVDPDWHPVISRHGFSSWLHQSFAWENKDYADFDDYLAVFNANQRRNIKRERKTLDKLGITLKTLSGDEIPDTFASLMYRFYARTNDKFGVWGCKYLTRGFFERLFESYRHRLLITAAYPEHESRLPLGLSLLLNKGDQLLGRYWGSFRDVNHLHFNACYYSPIEWAIAHGIKRFDPGAGSRHKLRRGFLAVSNYSLHRFYDARLHQIMQVYIDQINRMEQEQIDALNQQLPISSHIKSSLLSKAAMHQRM